MHVDEERWTGIKGEVSIEYQGMQEKPAANKPITFQYW